MLGTERSLCTVWVLRYAAPWRVVCRDRRVATDASRPPACLPVQLHLTGGDIAISAQKTRVGTHRTRDGAQTLHYITLLDFDVIFDVLDVTKVYKRSK